MEHAIQLPPVSYACIPPLSPSVLNLISDEIVLDTAYNALLRSSLDVDPMVQRTSETIVEKPGALYRGIL